jgi:hypothetical protein
MQLTFPLVHELKRRHEHGSKHCVELQKRGIWHCGVSTQRCEEKVERGV